MDCVRDPITGKPIGSIVYDKPSEVPEWHIINLLPLGAIGFGNAAKAVAMVQRIMEEEGHGVCEAVIKGVKLFGVTDPKIIEKIRSTGSPATTAATNPAAAVLAPSPPTPPASPSSPSPPKWLLAPLARLRGGAKPRPHERWMLRYLEPGERGEEREREKEHEGKNKAGEGGGGEEERKAGTGGEERVLGPERAARLAAGAVGGRYIPPHLRHKMPARVRSQTQE
ncbi:hypothetical protein TWF281_011323 [Arthrobotrys megalospora]